jgi:hypothetical protein
VECLGRSGLVWTNYNECGYAQGQVCILTTQIGIYMALGVGVWPRDYLNYWHCICPPPLVLEKTVLWARALGWTGGCVGVSGIAVCGAGRNSF